MIYHHIEGLRARRIGITVLTLRVAELLTESETCATCMTTSKFHKRSFAFIAFVMAVDIVVTDSGIPREDRKRSEQQVLE